MAVHGQLRVEPMEVLYVPRSGHIFKRLIEGNQQLD